MKKIIWLILYCVLLNTTYTFAQKVDKDFLDGEIYVKIKNEVPFAFDTLHNIVNIRSKLAFLLPLVNKYRITKAEASFYFSKSDILKRTFRIHFQNIDQVELFIRETKNLKQIEYAEKIPLMRMTYTPNDLQPDTYAGQYALYNIKAQDAWDVTRGDNSVMIAIVDNAIDINHPDLSGNVIKQWDVSDNDADPTPPNSNSSWNHGTHTSGIACATSDNNIGIASIGFYCDLIAVKATRDNNAKPTTIDHGYEGIAWAASNGAKVISCSWGGGTSTTGQNTIDDAYNANAIVIASAGNNNNSTILYPAGYNHVVAVASVDKMDIRASDSNFGNWVDVTAPGVSIYSTIPTSQPTPYGNMSGTSMAAPLVAGLCGIIRSLYPGLSYDAVVNCVVSSADNIDAENPGYIGQLGSGRINAYRAVECALICNPSINLGSGVYTVFKTESSGTITSENTIPVNAQVLLDAANTVDLLPGFVANNGCVFRAYIDGCGGSFALLDYQKQSAVNFAIAEHYYKTVNTLHAYPNPTTSLINLDFSLEHNENNLIVDVYDMNSKIVKRVSLGNMTTGNHASVLNLNELSSGIYLVVLKLSSSQITAKVVLVK